MKKSELKKLIRETLYEIDLKENHQRLNEGKVCPCGDPNNPTFFVKNCNGSCITCCKTVKDAIDGGGKSIPTYDALRSMEKHTSIQQKQTSGGPCICRNWQMGTDGSNKCIEWSPAGCGDAPFKVATNNPQIA